MMRLVPPPYAPFCGCTSPVTGCGGRLEAFYKLHNPEKLHTVPSILKKWKGREEKLFDTLEHKYSETGRPPVRP